MGLLLNAKYVPELKFHLDTSMDSYDEINKLLKNKMKEIISIWKPENITSYDVIRKIKHFFDSSLKIGHCGTLDPFASGILLICLGSNTKNIIQYMNLQKTYEATIKLNIETDTLDNTGKIIKIKSNPTTVNEKDIKNSILKLTGNNILQVPPFFSAKKVLWNKNV